MSPGFGQHPDRPRSGPRDTTGCANRSLVSQRTRKPASGRTFRRTERVCSGHPTRRIWIPFPERTPIVSTRPRSLSEFDLVTLNHVRIPDPSRTYPDPSGVDSRLAAPPRTHGRVPSTLLQLVPVVCLVRTRRRVPTNRLPQQLLNFGAGRPARAARSRTDHSPSTLSLELPDPLVERADLPVESSPLDK